MKVRKFPGLQPPSPKVQHDKGLEPSTIMGVAFWGLVKSPMCRCPLDFQILWQAAESRKQVAVTEEMLKEAAQRLAEFETEMLGIIHVGKGIMP